MDKALIIKYGEVALRHGNRYIFENKIIDIIKNKISHLGDYVITKEQGRLVIEYRGKKEFDFDAVIPLVVTTFGIVAVCPVTRLYNNDIQNINKYALLHMKDLYNKKEISFKVDVRRANKNYELDSFGVAKEVGSHILNNMSSLCVNVKNPDIKLNIEIRNNTYIYSQVIPAYGGLPVGMTGKGMLLLSGGIDSPVAGFMISKRGVQLEAIYFHTYGYVSERSKDKVIDLCKRLSIFNNKIKLNIVPFEGVQLYLKENVEEEKLTILIKRAMLKIANKVAESSNCYCLITGDSIGQVASQTLHSLNAMESSSELPIIRPLAGMDKQEIVDLAKKIGTYETSILPYDDCCTLFVAKNPETKPKRNIIERIENSLLELGNLLDEAVNKIETLFF